MKITINIIEASSKLAHKEVEKHFDFDAKKIYDCVSDNETEYTDYAKEIFNLYYNEYYDLLSSCITDTDVSRLKLDNQPDLNKQQTLEEATENRIRGINVNTSEMWKKPNVNDFDLKPFGYIHALTLYIEQLENEKEKSYTLEQISKDFMGENKQGGYFDDYLDFKLGLDTYPTGEDDKRKWADSLKDRDITFKEWFEQFKKK